MAYSEEKQPLLPEVEPNKVKYSGKYQSLVPVGPAISTTFRYRIFFSLLCSLAFMLNTSSRGIIAVTIVAMTNRTGQGDTPNDTGECQADSFDGNMSSYHANGEFNWDSQTQGIILSSFAYGYTLTQIPSGILASRYGGKYLAGFGIFFTAIMSLLVPTGARLGVGALITIQVVTGCSLGLVTPATSSIVGRVAPVMERSFISSIIFMGAPLGTVVSQSVSGVVSDSPELGGWPTMFYGYGVLAILWFVPWCLLVKDTPSIPNKNNNNANKISKCVPNLNILTSGPVWAILLAHFSYGWVYFTMTTFLPTYLSRALKYDISQNGVISSIPFLCCWVSQIFSGYVVDFFRRREIVYTLTARRICVVLCFIGSGIPLVTIYYAGCDKVAAVAIISLALFFCGFCVPGFLVNGTDIASNYAGQIMGLSNTLATFAGIIAPTLIGFIIEADPTRFGWHMVFCSIAGINVFGTICFLVLGKGEELSWNRNKEITIIVQRNQVYIEE